MAFGTPRGSGRTPPWAGLLAGLFGGISNFAQARQQTALLKRQQTQEDADRAAQEQDRALRTQALQENLRQAKVAPFLGFLKTAQEQYPAPEDQLALGQRAADLGSGQTTIGPTNAPAAPMTPFDARGSGPVTNDYAAAHPYPAQVTSPLAGLTLHETAKQQADQDAQRKGLEQLLLHAYGQGPENPAGIAGGLQSLYATGHLPQVDTQVPLPVGAPGVPGGVSVPTRVQGQVPLADILASGGKSAAERALAQKAQEGDLGRQSRERIAAISAGSKQYKSWDDFQRDISKEWLKGGGDLYQLGPYLDIRREEWNREHPTAAPLAGPPPAPDGQAAPPPLVLPGAAAKIGLQGAQAGAANANAAATPQRIIETGRHNLATEGTAAKNAETQRQAMEARKALGWENLSEAQVRDKWAHEDRQQASKDRIASISQRASAVQARVQSAAGRLANDPAFLPRVRDAQHELDGLRTQRRSYERAKSNAAVGLQNATDDATKQQAQNTLDESVRNIGTLDRKIDGAAGRLKGLLDQGPARSGGSGPAAAASPSVGMLPLSPSKSALRTQALQEYTQKYGKPTPKQANHVYQVVEHGQYVPGKM